MKITLPFPPSELSPNTRAHWTKKHTAAKKFKGYAMLSGTGLKPNPDPDGKIYLIVTFHPPAGYRYDQDNLIARMKSSLDGLAQAWKVDDHCFSITYKIGDVVKNGSVVVEWT